MDLESIRIMDFRSIKDTDWVEINGDITTLIGKNESGKTAILESLTELKHNNPISESDIHDSSDSNPFTPIIRATYTTNNGSNRIEITKFKGGARNLGPKSNISIIKPFSLELLSDVLNHLFEERSTKIDNNKINKFKKRNNIPSSNNIRDKSKEKIQEVGEVIINELLEEELNQDDLDDRSITSNIYDLLRNELKDERDIEYPISEYIKNKLPSVVYINSADQLPDEINKSNVGSDNHKTFNNLIRVSGFDPNTIDSMKAREQAEMIDEISTTIEGDLNKFWDQKTVEVNVREANSNYIPLVRDSEIGGEDVSREPRIPSERSNGFQWFLSFYINSKAEANDSNKKLFLLDDPAVYLHPEGKEDWLDAIEDLAEDNQIIYTSHSPYLIYKNRPSRVRIVEDQSESGTVVLDEFHSSNTASLEPLRNALGIGIGSSPFATKKKILVEGPSDKYILRGAIHYLDERGKDILQRNSISIIPTGGADKMIKAAKWVNSENFSYVVVLDKDQKGDTVVNRLKTDAPDLNEERIIQLEVDDDNINQHIEIEDMIPADFYVNCVNDVYQDEIDKYTPLKLSKEEGQKYINSVEYNDRKITSKINQVFDSAGYGDLDKLMVAKKIENRFISGEVDEDILSEFVILLGELAERI